MLRKLYDWTIEKSAHPHAERWLFAISFMESSFFPIPPHPLLGLMCLSNPDKALRYGVICTLSSVLGGLFGYMIGYLAYESIGIALLKALGLWESFPQAACYLREYGAEMILIKGATPIPFKLITLTAGFIHMDLWTFIWSSMISRSVQFMLVGFLFWKFGAPIKVFIEKYLGILSAAFLILVIGGFIIVGMLGGKGSSKESHLCSNVTSIEQVMGK
ncbi:cytochrome B [Sphingorhabdus lutea]|uniref:Cytochrome B n=1 Tax=Sphingorhabdus lutea TaxID=1913578 RepID=A0A1L3JAM8_9SPHN|nr:YqaA family protein [Sphingorhabdus lutea]APG62182.1 cytochrome B [Sphingorhabdus lutea]